MATLKEARIGQTVRVKKLNGEGAVKRRIMDMGITKGTEVYIRKVAPLVGSGQRIKQGGFACVRISRKRYFDSHISNPFSSF